MPTGDIETYRQSIERPEEFWAEAAEANDWERRWDRALDDSRSPFYLWFAGGRLNTCWSPLDCTMREIADGGRRSTIPRYWQKSTRLWQQPATLNGNRFRSPAAALPGHQTLRPPPAVSRESD
jgi:hypothetical protein